MGFQDKTNEANGWAETCLITSRYFNPIQSIEFTLTRIFMKLFSTGSSSTVNECQVNFGFLPAKSQILIPTASFLQKFIALENSLCTLLANDARRQLHNVFKQYGTNIKTACQLRNAVYIKFFDNL